MPYEQSPGPVPQEDGRHPLVQHENLPQELFSYAQWVCWRYVPRGAGRKPDKQPVNPHTLGNAGVGWANTWSDFDHAYAVYREHGLSGIGFVLTQDDPFVGADLDGCVGEHGCTPYAEGIMQQLESYTEHSPSGNGLRILVASPGYTENRRTQELEVYAHSRFLTLTGHHVEGTPRAIATVSSEQITTLVPDDPHGISVPSAQHREQLHQTVADMQLWERIFEHDRYGPQHLQRFQGDTSPDGNDHSLTVLRLLNTLARWTGGDAAKMRTMMLLSPLANDKWFSKRGKMDWLDYQIDNAISYVRRRS